MEGDENVFKIVLIVAQFWAYTKTIELYILRYILTKLLKIINKMQKGTSNFSLPWVFRGSTWVRSKIKGRNLTSGREMCATWAANLRLVGRAIFLRSVVS